ncbi:MAG: type II toxin-antitoxin system RelB/DinJ family antitoxin [Neisseriaceae bacterium]|nr:type II toxin-antitoxin system RelB/DinJ family antitoxin [Neisseriaceae bacterium]
MSVEVSIVLDEQEKTQLESLVNSMGLNLPTFFQIYAKRVLHDRKIPFELSALDDPFYSASNLQQILKAQEQVQNGAVLIKSMSELENMENA